MKPNRLIKAFRGPAAFTAALFLAAIPVTGCSADNPEKTGYWWYKDPPPEGKTQKTEHRQLPPPPPLEKLMEMHPDDIRDLLDNYHKQAVWKPTPDNIRDYYIVFDAARRKSLAVAAVTQVVMLEHPELNVAGEDPGNNPGREAMTRARESSTNDLLAKYQDSYALIVFTEKGCQFCAAQRNALQLFAEKYHWEIKDIDKDDFPDLAARFGVGNFTPMTYLIERGTDKKMPVAVGAETVAGITENTYRGIRLLRGDITPEQFFTMDYQEGGVFDPGIKRGAFK